AVALLVADGAGVGLARRGTLEQGGPDAAQVIQVRKLRKLQPADLDAVGQDDAVAIDDEVLCRERDGDRAALAAHAQAAAGLELALRVELERAVARVNR